MYELPKFYVFLGNQSKELGTSSLCFADSLKLVTFLVICHLIYPVLNSVESDSEVLMKII